MKTSDLITYVVLASIAVLAYIFIPNAFVAGCITGFIVTLMVLSLIGKGLFKKSAERIDKNVRDILASR